MIAYVNEQQCELWKSGNSSIRIEPWIIRFLCSHSFTSNTLINNFLNWLLGKTTFSDMTFYCYWSHHSPVCFHLRLLPIFCKSFHYNSATRLCLLSDSNSFKSKQNSVKPSKTLSYHEGICIYGGNWNWVRILKIRPWKSINCTFLEYGPFVDWGLKLRSITSQAENQESGFSTQWF